MELTPATVRLMIALRDSDDSRIRHYSWNLRVACRMRAAIVFATIDMFCKAGWLSDHWQTPEEANPAHEPRRYYLVTEKGRQEMLVHLSRARQDGRFEDLFPAELP